MSALKLYHTPLSHFSRKVRILMAAMHIEIKLIDVGNVARSQAFGCNPLMKVPALMDGEKCIFDSDHIAQYIVEKYDPTDPFSVLTTNRQQRNARAVMNGIMASEVELILAQRTGLNINQYSRFDKIKDSMTQGLNWLEDRAEIFSGDITYLDFHLVSMLDHIVYYQMITIDHKQLLSRAHETSQQPYVKASKPC